MALTKMQGIKRLQAIPIYIGVACRLKVLKYFSYLSAPQLR